MKAQSEEFNLELLPQEQLSPSIKQAPPNTSIIVDFDETLFLLNSSAEYLNSLQPRFIAAIILKVLSFTKPWRFLIKSSKDSEVRDWFLIIFLTLLLPWNIFLWQNTAKKFARNYSNYELITELSKNNKTNLIIATLGFQFVVEPILKSMAIEYNQLISCRFWQGASDRKKGKLAMVQESMKDEQISEGMLITDSLDDESLLKEVAYPFLITWSKAQYNSPMADIYFPLYYLEKIKRPGENYLLKAILLDDFPILFLAFSWLSPQPVLHGISIIFLAISFWCIYEYGYYENDLVAEKYENDPQISQNYLDYKHSANWWIPWIWSIAFGGIGIVFLEASRQATSIFDWGWLQNSNLGLDDGISLGIYWIGFLLVSRLCFWVYNYVNKKTRIWLYLLLQITRYCGFLVVTASNIVGMSALLCQIFVRSISYIIYRYAGGTKKSWPDLPEQFLKLLLFVPMIVGLSIVTADWSILFGGQTLAFLLWFLLRSRNQTRKIIGDFKLLRQDGAN
ncbi:hypothetical protein Xen7305DRAFT_00043730 [Xenococcus sp. PCC 7305]|uniref:hypothetical protein n=1 Tax=Xenococcus sp. PCC 7305 TaxID=102125 RepID=UPI0002AC49E6|nr:hypothetical protein [Xenococcus sp. PCC 7305]ELS04637.1 hypothetical protein Xen7305DRAFT_00043730 [Xenococcus sp. PCC 7305]